MVQYTDNNGACPDISLVMEAVWQNMAKQVRDRICTEIATAMGYTDSEVAKLQAQITGLGDIDGITAKLGELQAFLSSLDENGDGNIDALVTLQQQVEALQAKASELESAVATNSSSISDLAAELQSFVSTTSSTLNEMAGDVAAVKVTAAQAETKAAEAKAEAADAQNLANQANTAAGVNTAEIAGLKQKIENLETIDQETVQGIIDAEHCATNARVRDAVNRAAAAFTAEFSLPCSVGGGSEDPVASDDPV